jgi:spermidine/putrescine transport system ATP-binding protein
MDELAPVSASAAEAPMIRVAGASKSFVTKDLGTVTALKTVSIEIGANEFFTLLGPSGCGKTTLLRLIGGFETPTTGTIQIDSADVAALPPQMRPVNTVFQSYALFPHMNAAENVAFGLEMCRWAPADITARVAESLAMVRLEDLAGRRPHQLSGGQQQRVALARALAPRPKVLLLDEPLSALDLKLRKEMQGELKRLQRETGIAFILVTHDQEEALAMSDRIAVMRDGEILQVGSPGEIYDNPNCRFVADFIGEANLIPGAVLGRATDVTVVIRPERVSIKPGDAGRLRGTVSAVTFLGLDTLYEIAIAGEVKIRARMRDAEAPSRVGDAVAVDWPDRFEHSLRA